VRGRKTFPSVVPDRAPGSDWSTRRHPVQCFQSGDYSAKPGRESTYAVHALGPPVAAPTVLASVRLRGRTEVEDVGDHGVWTNRVLARRRPSRGGSRAGCPVTCPDPDAPAPGDDDRTAAAARSSVPGPWRKRQRRLFAQT
jgi:hypothetical protein